jgi:hypothetical protein
MFNFFSNKNFKNFFNDILRDSQSKKTSLTRILAILLFIVVIWFHYEAIKLMVQKKEVDHALLLEDFTFISALIMQKNYINRNIIDKKEEEPIV